MEANAFYAKKLRLINKWFSELYHFLLWIIYAFEMTKRMFVPLLTDILFFSFSFRPLI